MSRVLVTGAAGVVGGYVTDAFAGHEICDSGRWLNSVNWLDLGASYHPNAAGQAYGYLPAFTAAAAG